MFFAIGFETTAPANAMAVWRAQRDRSQEFLSPRFACARPAGHRGHLQSPQNRVQGFLGPGHVCAVMGYREYEAISARYEVPIVVTGFEPLDLLEGTLMTVRQLEAGRAEVENQYARAVERGGNRAGANAGLRKYSRSVIANGAASARSPRAASGCATNFAITMPSGCSKSKRSIRKEPADLHQRPDLEGNEEAARLSGLRDALHAANSARRHHGFRRRRLRRLLRLWTPP